MSLSFVQSKYEMWDFLSMCPQGYSFVNHLFADPYRKEKFLGMVYVIPLKSSDTFLDITSALK